MLTDKAKGENKMPSKATLSRLPEYLNYIRCLPAKTQCVSATAIAKGLDLGEVQVRKDLASICGNGKPKTGYCVTDLSAALETALGIRSESEAVIVGAGKLGTALLGFGGFADYGICVRRAFDCNPLIASEKVLPVAELPSYCALHQVEIGIIAVPPSDAQAVADLLVKSGIRAIWCFAVCRLEVPENVTVQYENMALSLAHLKNRINYNY